MRLLVALVSAYSVFGIDLSSALKSKIQQQLESITPCTPQTTFCPLSNVPEVTFPSSGGSVVSTSSQSCCPGTFKQCQVQQNKQFCRDLALYEITPGQGNSEEVCPPTTPECVCQQSLAGEKNLFLRLCPTPGRCCPSCECHGDPHCTSFGNKVVVWATCDDRDATCQHKAETCTQTKFDNKPCQWKINSGGKGGYCTRDETTKTPQMMMYKKTYRNYWNPSDNTEYEFSMMLTLGTYGSISSITIKDAGQTYNFGFNGFHCLSDPSYPLNGVGKVHINNLPSMVRISLTCYHGLGYSPTAQRWDVNEVEDPWFVDPHPDQETFEGFCASGIIPEMTGEEASGGCSIIDRQLTMAVVDRCTANTPVDTCKKKWCDKNYLSMYYGPGKPVTKAACYQFVLDQSGDKANFVKAVCSISPAVKSPGELVDVTKCREYNDCSACVDAIFDFPDDIKITLGNAREESTPAPTIPCASNLLSVGLQRKQLLPQGSGIQIDFLNNGVWTGVFALFDEEIIACGGCRNFLTVNGSVPENAPLLNAGKYRIKQCVGLDTDPKQDLCPAAPQYNVSVSYTSPIDGVALSTPFGELWNAGDLECSRTKYKLCPPNYRCCQWNGKQGGEVVWEMCMDDLYPGWRTKYKNCEWSP